MRKMFNRGRAAKAAGLVLSLALAVTFASATRADAPHPVKLRGTILSLQGGVMSARGQDGGVIKIKIAPQTRLAAVVPASLAGIKPGSFVGITSMPGDGSERIALEVHIFPKPCAGPAKATAPGTKAPAAG